MLQRDEFTELIGNAFSSLYDLVALRTHPLVNYLTDDKKSAKERGWQLHHLLFYKQQDV